MTLNRDSFGSLSVVDIPERCGNAPRKAVVRDFTIALASKNAAEVLAVLSADVRWMLNRKEMLSGIDEIRDWITTQPDAKELKIFTVITHGTECGVDGTVTFTDGASMIFSHVMRFTGGAKSAKIKEIRSYLISS